MYLYVKGTTVISEERFIPAEEIAYNYGLWLPTLDGCYVPNSALVTHLIDDYVKDHNYNMSDYYYISLGGLMSLVYPPKLISAVLDPFVSNILKDFPYDPGRVLAYKDIEFILYKQEKEQKICQVVDIDQYKKEKGKKNEN